MCAPLNCLWGLERNKHGLTKVKFRKQEGAGEGRAGGQAFYHKNTDLHAFSVFIF